MGAAHSHEDLEICESDEEEYEEYEERREQQEEEDEFVDSRDDDSFAPSSSRLPPSSSLDDVESKLRALKLKYPSTQQQAQTSTKLFRYINGNTPKAKWVTAEKLTSYSFVKTSQYDEDQDDDDDDRNRDSEKEWWVLKVGRSKIREKVSDEMQLKAYKDQRRVDFVAKGVWALRFGTVEDFNAFVRSYNNCLFENNHGVEFNEASKAKIFGKDFIGWANPEAADDSMWEDADDLLLNSPQSATPVRDTQDLTEAFEEATSEGIHSLALGALDNSFLVGGSGIQAGKTKTGFEGRMGNKIAAPRLLKLRPLDAHLAGSNNKFRNAQFSWVTEDGKQERHVVATVGKFSVIWNFQQVKNGSHECYHEQEGLKKCYCYKIVLRNESIVDSRFMNDNFAVSGSPEAPLVIATPMKVSSFSISSKR
ncbi:hypothetical protein BRARA_H01269 [Brassica rapa]|uniref:Uncharacterized protein n=1 Tax=Brassica campestris TaxID=3711 RepID=A0A397YFC2_BRACM|nr:hypothetical protein BRARA_H01269 [Brassica rapa]